MTDPQESAIKTVVHNILEREGGIADVGDGAGLTRFGQTPAWLTRWRLPVPTSTDEAAMNYRSWMEANEFDALCTEDDSLPDVVIDFAVHAGEKPAIQALQRALRVQADGIIGPVTMTALATCHRPQVAAQVLAARLRLFGSLLSQPHNTAYARGWLNRIAAQVGSLA